MTRYAGISPQRQNDLDMCDEIQFLIHHLTMIQVQLELGNYDNAKITKTLAESFLLLGKLRAQFLTQEKAPGC